MTGLLVSVRSREEARAALAGGADLIDIKEPSRGSLGAAELNTWREIQETVGSKVPISAALGELLDFAEETVRHLHGMQYAKLGLAGCREACEWRQRWAAARALISCYAIPVAVAYADWQVAKSPTPDDVLQTAVDVGYDLLLLDTYQKSQGTLLDVMSVNELERFVKLARSHTIRVVLGGSLSSESILAVLHLAPDFIAVRGAVCRGTRTGNVDERLVRQLAGLISRYSRREISTMSSQKSRPMS